MFSSHPRKKNKCHAIADGSRKVEDDAELKIAKCVKVSVFLSAKLESDLP